MTLGSIQKGVEHHGCHSLNSQTEVFLPDYLFTIFDDNTFGLCIGFAAIERVATIIFQLFALDCFDARCLVDGAAAGGAGGGQRVAVAVDGAVVDQGADAGVGCQVPDGSAVDGDVGCVARVVFHLAAVGAVGENQVAHGSAG